MGVIICDTREKRNEHILRYFDRHGVAYRIGKVDTGDYMDEERPKLRLERKANLAEMAHNLLSPDRARFYREIRRAREAGIRLLILCEQSGIQGLADVQKWVPKYGRASGRALAEAIYRLEVAYAVPVFFCGRRSAGKQICELLGGENDGDEDLLRGG